MSDIQLLMTEIAKRFHIPPKGSETTINKGFQGGGTYFEVPPRSHHTPPKLFVGLVASVTIVYRWKLGGI